MKAKNEKEMFPGIWTAVFVFLLAVVLLIGKNGCDLSFISKVRFDNIFVVTLVIWCVYFIKGIVMFIPLTGLYLAVGAVYSHEFTAIAVNVVGISIALTIAYINGRFIDNKKFDKYLKKYPKLAQLNSFEQGNPLMFTYIIRVIGFLPCDVVSLYCGVVRIPYRYFMAGSLAGMLPGIILTSVMGANIKNPHSPQFIISVLIQISTSVFSVVLYHKIKNSKITGDKS